MRPAIDIEPRPRFSAWLAWATYQADPRHELESSLSELARACTQDASSEEAWVWRGDLAMALSRQAEAEDAYRKAYKLSPNNKRYVELIKSAASMIKKERGLPRGRMEFDARARGPFSRPVAGRSGAECCL